MLQNTTPKTPIQQSKAERQIAFAKSLLVKNKERIKERITKKKKKEKIIIIKNIKIIIIKNIFALKEKIHHHTKMDQSSHR